MTHTRDQRIVTAQVVINYCAHSAFTIFKGAAEPDIASRIGWIGDRREEVLAPAPRVRLVFPFEDEVRPYWYMVAWTLFEKASC